MNWRKNQTLWTSVILHVVVIFALFLATIIEAFKPKEEAHVFVMVDPPSDQPQDAPPAPPVELPQPDAELPDMPTLQPIPDLPDPAPTPPPPAPTPPKPKPKPKPTPTPTPTPTKPKILSYEDFVRQQGKPEPIIRTPQPTRTNVPDVKIDTSRAQRELEARLRNQPSAPSPASSAQAMKELDAYQARLSAMLSRAWSKPSGLSGVSLVVEVIFDVAPNGRISNIRLNPSSGNNSFDQSVLAAFQKVGSAGPTPTGGQHTFSKRFRMTD